jgi:MFS family permease
MTASAAPQEGVRLGANYWKLWSASVSSNIGDGIGLVAYLWLASAVTRSPMLIALIGVAQRLPWLLFTLPAGVITDRFDRRKIMVAMDVLRSALTFGVAGAVVLAASTLPGIDEITTGIEIPTNAALYSVLLIASLLFGMAEVLRDNTAQTFCRPSSTRGTWSAPTATCGEPRWWRTRSSARRSAACCSESASPSPSSWPEEG